MTFDLPMPPSLWDLYTGRGRSQRKSKAYKSWINEAGWMLIHSRNFNRSKVRRIACDISVHLDVCRPQARGMDLDNILKSCIDLLKHTNTIRDDNQVVKLSAVFTNDGVPVRMTVNELEERQKEAA